MRALRAEHIRAGSNCFSASRSCHRELKDFSSAIQ